MLLRRTRSGATRQCFFKRIFRGPGSSPGTTQEPLPDLEVRVLEALFLKRVFGGPRSSLGTTQGPLPDPEVRVLDEADVVAERIGDDSDPNAFANISDRVFEIAAHGKHACDF